MATTENGWPVLAPSSSLIVPLTVAGRSFPGGVRSGAVKTLLWYLATQYHLRVESLYYGATDKDDWGYANRPPSNHASASAIDVNATTNPQGVEHSHTYAQELVIRAILRECGGVVRWGRDFRSTPDPMHFDLKPGSTLTSVTAAAKRINNPPWWHRQIEVGMTGADVAYARRRLGLTTGSTWDSTAVRAMKATEARLQVTQTGKVAKSRAIILGTKA